VDLPTTDIVGNPRIYDGDYDGIERVDVGAFEYFVPEPSVNCLVFIIVGLMAISRRNYGAQRKKLAPGQ
jgi:hypothetical protein